MKKYLFVYGSLKENFKNYSNYLKPYHLGKPIPAKIKGRLYQLKDKDYPAVLLNSVNDTVYGEAYPFEMISPTLLKKLDVLEGYNQINEVNEYERVHTFGELIETEEKILCVVYVMTQLNETMTWLESGNWEE